MPLFRTRLAEPDIVGATLAAMDGADAKRAAGEAAAQLIDSGMTVGLGTGSTAYHFILALGARVRDGLAIRAVATSRASAALAVEQGIEVGELDAAGLDLTVDGADQVDPELRLIKGFGGAHLREKIVASASRRFVVAVDESKVVERLSGRVPVELLHFGAEATLAALEKSGGNFSFRLGPDGAPMRSDNGNVIADGSFTSIDDPEALAAHLDAVPGLLGHGLFLGMTDLVIIGTIGDGAPRVRELRRGA